MPLPGGITSVYLPNEGVYQRTETCERCGKQRSKVTLPPGIYPALPSGPYAEGATWRYVDPDNWIRMTEDEQIDRGDVNAEFDYRMKELLYPRGKK
jgi:hypothetical protein